MTRLSVNIDHVATVRQARRGARPDPVQAAVVAELAGADGITCHLREDRRHIQDRDLERLRAAVTTRLNVEMAARAPMAAVARRVRPELVTLVPERAGEVTTEGGIDVVRGGARLRRHIAGLRRARIEVSLFVDPDPRQIAAAAASGAGMVELNTDAWARAASARRRAREFDRLVVAARLAAEAGLAVAAGHALDTGNVRPVADIPEVEELNIGHAIVARAVIVGLERAVREMIEAIGG